MDINCSARAYPIIRASSFKVIKQEQSHRIVQSKAAQMVKGGLSWASYLFNQLH